MYKNKYIILLLILVITIVVYWLINYYKKKQIIRKILQEWKNKTNGGYIKIDDNGRYKGDYYLSINNVENYHSHIHLIINYRENSLCYKIKKNDNHSQLYIINNTKFDNIVEEMIQKYNHFED